MACNYIGLFVCIVEKKKNLIILIKTRRNAAKSTKIVVVVHFFFHYYGFSRSLLYLKKYVCHIVTKTEHASVYLDITFYGLLFFFSPVRLESYNVFLWIFHFHESRSREHA